jgi:hypothetical protein
MILPAAHRLRRGARSPDAPPCAEFRLFRAACRSLSGAAHLASIFAVPWQRCGVSSYGSRLAHWRFYPDGGGDKAFYTSGTLALATRGHGRRPSLPAATIRGQPRGYGPETAFLTSAAVPPAWRALCRIRVMSGSIGASKRVKWLRRFAGQRSHSTPRPIRKSYDFVCAFHVLEQSPIRHNLSQI